MNPSPMVRSVSSIPAHSHLPRQPEAAPENGAKYGDHFGFPFAGRLNEARACLQHPPQAMRKSYALCVVCGNPRTLKR